MRVTEWSRSRLTSSYVFPDSDSTGPLDGKEFDRCVFQPALMRAGINKLIETKETTIQHQHGLLRELRAAAAERLDALLQKEQLIAALEAERSSLSARLAAVERGLLWRVALSLAHRVRSLAGGREHRQHGSHIPHYTSPPCATAGI